MASSVTDARTRDEMGDAFSNYDQCVEIVGCWHSWYSAIPGAAFDHFPVVEIEGVHRTPDFLVVFDSGYQLVGEVCRLPMQNDGFKASVEQAVGYGALSQNTDVMMLIPHEYADEAEKRMLDEGLLSSAADGEPLVVLSFVRTEATRVTLWVFKRPTQLRHVSFRDDALLGEDSLHHKMTESLEGLKVPPKYWRDMKIRFPFCNDNPPALYTACVLWEKVFSGMLNDDDYLRARVEKLSHLPLSVTADATKAACLAQLDLDLPVGWIHDALELLEEARLAERTDRGSQEYHIKFGKIIVPGSENRETHRLILDRLYGKYAEVAVANDVQQEALFEDSATPSADAEG